MTAYLRAATAFRSVAVLAALVTVWLVYAGHPWWAVFVGWVAFLGFFMGRLLNLGHNSTVTGRVARTRHALTDKENTIR